MSKQRRKLGELQQVEAELTAHHRRRVADNDATGAVVPASFRRDGGLGSGPNVTGLIEMGDEVDTKAHNARVTAALLAAKPDEGAGEHVGRNAEVGVQAGVRVSNCPYPLDVALERFHTGETVRHGTLLHDGSEPGAAGPAGWFHRYNARQILGAAIKENKAVFEMRHLKLRSPAGLALVGAFALFAATLVRFAAAWLAQPGQANPPPFTAGERPISVKQMARTGANTSARVIRQPSRGVVVSFTDRSPYAGLELAIGCESGFQPPLPLLKSLQISPRKTIWVPVAQSLR